MDKLITPEICDYLWDLGIYTLAFMTAFGMSTWIIKCGIVPRAKRAQNGSSHTEVDQSALSSAISEEDKWAGFWIGFCETLVIFLLVSAGEYGALAIILGAKEFVRKEKIQANASYYLLGTMANFAVALLLVRLAMALASWN
jgi:hypothetical protein